MDEVELRKKVRDLDIAEVIDWLIRKAYETAKSKGWHEEPGTVGDSIALMHTELSEALEEFRAGGEPNACRTVAGKPEGVAVELADCVIRIFDFCGKHDVPLASALLAKMRYNETRPYRHGGKRL